MLLALILLLPASFAQIGSSGPSNSWIRTPPDRNVQQQNLPFTSCSLLTHPLNLNDFLLVASGSFRLYFILSNGQQSGTIFSFATVTAWVFPYCLHNLKSAFFSKSNSGNDYSRNYLIKVDYDQSSQDVAFSTPDGTRTFAWSQGLCLCMLNYGCDQNGCDLDGMCGASVYPGILDYSASFHVGQNVLQSMTALQSTPAFSGTSIAFYPTNVNILALDVIDGLNFAGYVGWSGMFSELLCVYARGAYDPTLHINREGFTGNTICKTLHSFQDIFKHEQCRFSG